MIQVNLDVMMAKRKISLNDLAKKMDLSLANLSILKNNKCRAIRFSTLSNLCRILDCEVGDILLYTKGEQEDGTNSDDFAG
jgi:putative transcriptional regulator